MNEPRATRITQMLRDLGRAEPAAPETAAQLSEVIYEELRRMAGRIMRGERSGHTLQPTALVHEAYLRLVDSTRLDWKDRAHFYAIAARVMRRVLMDHARRRHRLKRGGDATRVTWDDNLAISPERVQEALSFDRALTRLAEYDQRMERVVELRVFGGMTVREVAQVLGVSERTVDGDWMVARQWLARELAR